MVGGLFGVWCFGWGFFKAGVKHIKRSLERDGNILWGDQDYFVIKSEEHFPDG